MIGVQLALNEPRAWKSYQAHPTVLLGDIGQVKLVRPINVSVSVGTKIGAWFASNVPQAWKSF
jgi:hypothetical protein